MRKRLVVVGSLAVVVSMMSCGESVEPTPDPTPGWLAVRMTTPNSTDDGGILFTVSGGPIDSVRSPFADVFVNRIDANTWRVLVAGSLTAGAIMAEVLVPDVADAANYTGTIEQVAARDPILAQRNAAGYGLTLQQP